MREPNKSVPMTALDQALCDDHLQAAKAMIPYLSSDEQSVFSVLIKWMELQRTFRMFRRSSSPDLKIASTTSNHASLTDILRDVRQYTGGTAGDEIDSLLNAIQMMQLFQSTQETDDELS